MKRGLFILLVLISATAAHAASMPQIKLDTAVEEGKKQLRATVTLDDKPLQNVVVRFSVARTFGNMIIGTDTTLDDGTAAVDYPTDVPGGVDGTLLLLATITGPDQYASISTRLTSSGAPKIAIDPDPFPRALWAPHAPVWLLASISTLLAGVWITYVFVVYQIVRIKKGAAQ